MWALVINPTSGSGKGATIGKHVAAFLSARNVEHQIISGNSAISMASNLAQFIGNFPKCSGVIAVGGDGLVHLILQMYFPPQLLNRRP